MKIEATPWSPQDLLDDLQEIITEEPESHRRTTLCMALDYLKAHFAGLSNEPLTLEALRELDGDKIFIRYIGSCKGFYADETAPYYGKFEQYVHENNGMLQACDLPLKYYGKTWMAYRSKPEDVDAWISVETRLPESGKEVLLLAHGWEGRLHYIGKLAPSPAQEGFFGVSKASDWTIWGWSYFREPKVTHWMPLPEPPELQGEEEGHETD